MTKLSVFVVNDYRLYTCFFIPLLHYFSATITRIFMYLLKSELSTTLILESSNIRFERFRFFFCPPSKIRPVLNMKVYLHQLLFSLSL